jgi:hypothetical protein
MILMTLSRVAENSGGEYCEDLPHTSVATFCMIRATPMVVSTQEYCPPTSDFSRSSGRNAIRSSPHPMSASTPITTAATRITGTPASSNAMLR